MSQRGTALVFVVIAAVSWAPGALAQEDEMSAADAAAKQSGRVP
jgi:hypothetical protein